MGGELLRTFLLLCVFLQSPKKKVGRTRRKGSYTCKQNPPIYDKHLKFLLFFKKNDEYIRAQKN